MNETFQREHEKTFRRTARHIPEQTLPEKIGEDAKLMRYRGHDEASFGARVEAEQGPEARATFETVCAIAHAVHEANGHALLVGGSVRDEVLGVPSKDFDVEIYGLSGKDVERIITPFGRVDAVGRTFGILKLTKPGALDIDISLPRTDSKIGTGHRGFEVKVDPAMSIREAAKRRDFTFNALSKDPLTGEIFDPFNGVKDLRERRLRVTDTERFRDDPLRVFRGAQFIARFGLRPDTETLTIMQSMVPELVTLPKERMREEWEKLLLKSKQPSLGLYALHEMGVIERYYPELQALHGTEQEFDWHPEGDVWTHTLLVADSAAAIIRYYGLTGEEARTVMWASLCHDLGKPETTEYKDGRIRSHGHESAGVEPTKKFLEKIGLDNNTVAKCIALVRDHLWPGVMYIKQARGEDVTDGAFRRLAKRIYPATVAELSFVAEADHRGRGPFVDPAHLEQFLLPDPFVAGAWIRKRAQELAIYKEVPRPILQGRDLIGLGFEPGKEFGRVIALAEDLRDQKNFTREQILELVSRAASLWAVRSKLTEALNR